MTASTSGKDLGLPFKLDEVLHVDVAFMLVSSRCVTMVTSMTQYILAARSMIEQSHVT